LETEVGSQRVPDEWTAEFAGRETLVQRRLREQLLRTHLPKLLRYEDRNSMAHSIESRVPFLDYRLVEFCQQLPDELKVRGAVTKVVLRSAMGALVPAAILNRTDKMGFVTPEEVWMRQTFPAAFRRELDAALETTSTLVATDRVRRDCLRVLEEPVPFDFSIWRLLCLARWQRRFAVSE